MLELNKIYEADCLEKMKEIDDKSIDMVLCDLPYGTTACKWDTIIPFEPLWKQYKRIIKDNGAIVLTASQPFTSALVMSNIKMFKYEWIWEKTRGTGFLTATKIPLKVSENILVFYSKQPTYNPQKFKGKPYKAHPGGSKSNGIYGQNSSFLHKGNIKGEMFPRNIIKFKIERGLHPTQKPVALFEYLIKTYTNEGDLVLDNCIGSGTTAVACINLKRNWIGIEKEEKYCNIANERIKNLPIKLIN